MYSETGEKIQNLAKTLLVLGIIANLILGIVIGGIVIEATYETGAGLFVGLIIIILGCISSYLSYLFLAGYGELIANTAENARQTKAVLKELRSMQVPNAPKTKNAESAKQISTKKADTAKRGVKCGKCGYDQEYSGLCPMCGSSIKKYYEYEEEDACEHIDPTKDNIEETAVDYRLAQMIRQKVSAFSAQKTKEQLEKLKQIPAHTLSPKDLAQLQYEIETCEIHLLEFAEEAADESNVCPSCGTELEAHARFCSKCGTAIQ